MKTQKNILVAFLLNLSFSVFELFGGIITNSVSILSDSIHDVGDAISIGISYFLERRSKRQADKNYTYGYARFSVLGGVITTSILIVGSVLVIIGAIKRIINPVVVDYSGMIIFAIVGVILNFIAAYVTRDGDSINQKAVNLHMLEDVFGWVVVLIGAIIMNFTDIKIIDPIISIGVAIFILFHSINNLKEVLDLFLEKTPNGIDIDIITKELCQIDDVDGVHHIHVWSMDGVNNLATMHIVTKTHDLDKVKCEIRNKLKEYKIGHAILETESDACDSINCSIEENNFGHHEHHHRHHHL